MMDHPASTEVSAVTRNRIVIPIFWGYVLAWAIFQIWAIFWAPPAWSQATPLDGPHDLPAAIYQPDPFVPEPRGTLFTDPPEGASWFARISVHNRTGTYNEVETHPTEYGDVLMEYLTTRPSTVGDSLSADSACILALPDGVIAQPVCLTIMEQETESIFLLLFIGG